jgi:hypothetical protein
MNVEPEGKKPFIGRGDRALLILLCVVFAIGFGGAHFVINSWQPNDNFESFLKYFGREVSATLLLFTSLVAIRCIISTPQLDKKLATVTLKVIVSMTLIGCAITASLLLALFAQF